MANSAASRGAVIRLLASVTLFAYLIYNVTIQDTAELNKQISDEINASQNIIPTATWNNVVRKTEATFNMLVTKYKLIENLNNTLIPDPDSKVRGLSIPAEKMSSFLYTAVQNIPLMIFQTLYRWNLLVGWSFVFAPFLIALLADGMYQWKLKRYVFGKVTVQFYRVWFRAFWLIGILTTIYLVTPNMSLFNNVAQLFPPAALFILGVALNRLWANYQKLM